MSGRGGGVNARRTAVSCQRSLGAGVGGVAGGKCLMVGGGGGTARSSRLGRMRSSRVEWANWHLPSASKGQCPARKYLQIFVKRLLAISS